MRIKKLYMNCLSHRIISRTKDIPKQPSAMVWKQADLDWILILPLVSSVAPGKSLNLSRL